MAIETSGVKTPSKTFIVSLVAIFLIVVQQLSATIPSPPSPWSVSGLEPGTTMKDAVSLLGEVEIRKVPIDDDNYYDSMRWGPDIFAEFADEKAEIISGSALQFNGLIVLNKGDGRKKILRMLGRPEEQGSDFLFYRREIGLRLFLTAGNLNSVQITKAKLAE